MDFNHLENGDWIFLILAVIKFKALYESTDCKYELIASFQFSGRNVEVSAETYLFLEKVLHLSRKRARF